MARNSMLGTVLIPEDGAADEQSGTEVRRMTKRYPRFKLRDVMHGRTLYARRSRE